MKPYTHELLAEAQRIRARLESCKFKNTPMLLNSFPVESCKHSSLLLAYHLLKIWPHLCIYGVGGKANKYSDDGAISHYWLEANNNIIDITADQYNLIDNQHLNEQIIKSRPFAPIITSKTSNSTHYKLFNISYRDTFTKGLQELADDTMCDLEETYETLFPGQ